MLVEDLHRDCACEGRDGSRDTPRRRPAADERLELERFLRDVAPDDVRLDRRAPVHRREESRVSPSMTVKVEAAGGSISVVLAAGGGASSVTASS